MQNENNARHSEHTIFLFLCWPMKTIPKVNWIALAHWHRPLYTTHAYTVCKLGLGGFAFSGIAKVTNVAIMCILCLRTCRCGSRFSSSTLTPCIVYENFPLDPLYSSSSSSCVAHSPFSTHFSPTQLINISMAANARKLHETKTTYNTLFRPYILAHTIYKSW